ncbi:Ras-related protein Rab-21 [Hondaea fermentalgiana]|uniref:Ras-related protein Rab-21 n=1 Tax=Hondaea fermentalgiana TaxID=2315210 RepID=A0A2R5GYC9_9STRA|nr:Ras-related protein Rab-21 [Hondaea fermentalgiana]|eukprot:GBG33461.1 Ras-related protein Rab-21 [Hondaea fermentalgiana]
MVMLGDAGVGKTSLVLRLCHDTFDDSSTPTLASVADGTGVFNELGKSSPQTDFGLTFSDQASEKDHVLVCTPLPSHLSNPIFYCALQAHVDIENGRREIIPRVHGHKRVQPEEDRT